MNHKFLIIGCGISGISFSWQLKKSNLDFKIIDPCLQNSSSFIAGGLINPITGRKYNLQWNIHELLKHAHTKYLELEEHLKVPILKEINILKIHKSASGNKEWEEEKKKKNPHLLNFIDENFNSDYFRNILYCESGGIIIKNGLQINTRSLISAYQKKLISENKLLQQEFKPNDLNASEEEIVYNNETFSHIIFCDGIHALQNQYFNRIPFKPAKGECFILEINELPDTYTYHKGVILIPFEKNIFWAGATNTWDDLSASPNAAGKKELETQLKELLKIPYKILEHKTAIRPTIKDRSPVVGQHPVYRNIFILNGMGTKGMSLAPYYAEILLQHILTGDPIPKEANVVRFAQHLK
ncbi:MAG: FAD-binding oxidoreductase [Fimbriimonadaceae bacterium]|nr:FAD-binding oxidoreductase [Chitinophagales bacterium]